MAKQASSTRTQHATSKHRKNLRTASYSLPPESQVRRQFDYLLKHADRRGLTAILVTVESLYHLQMKRLRLPGDTEPSKAARKVKGGVR